jgi:hypothetical protein
MRTDGSENVDVVFLVSMFPHIQEALKVEAECSSET